MIECSSKKGICKYVKYFMLYVDMNESEELSFNKFTNKMKINIYMFFFNLS